MEYASLISLIISIISIAIAVYVVYLSRKTYRLQSARPHSERVGEEFSKWLPKVSVFILNPANFPDDEDALKYHKIEEPPFYLHQHFESGYPEIYEKYERWENSVSSFNTRLKEFVEELKREAKKSFTLPSSNETAYYQRIISYSFKKILTRLPKNSFGFYTSKGLITSENFKKTQDRIELKWRGATLVSGDRYFCTRAEKFIKKLLNSPRKIKEFSKEFEKLIAEWNILAEEIKTKIVDKAKYGGIIQGKCDACC